jgi:hypothetical protein
MPPAPTQFSTKAVRHPPLRFATALLACAIPLFAGSACADEFRTAAISTVRVEWRAVLDQIRSEVGTQPAVASAFTFSGQRRLPAFDPRSTPALVQLNAVTSQIFTGISRSPVPVLLPFDTAAFLDARLNGASGGVSIARYQADFGPAEMFDAGLAGYDALFTLEPGAGEGMPQRSFVKPVEVQITGSILTYDISDPQGGKGEPVKALAAQFPDLRRFIREGYVRYAFTRFGVPYVVSVQCLDSSPRARRLACREAYPVAERFLKALRIAGRAADRAFPRFHLSAERRHPRQRLAQTERPRRLHRLFANPLSAGKSPGLRPLAVVRHTPVEPGRLDRRQYQLSMAGQFLRAPQLQRRTMRQRLWPPGPGYPARTLPAA